MVKRPKFAPDGSLYIADWYNPVIGHYQASFRHPDRDKVHGRIWRVTAKGRDLVKPPAFLKTGTESKVADVVKGLESDERFVRDFARRILGAMKKDEVIAAVQSWVSLSGRKQLAVKANDEGSEPTPPRLPRRPRITVIPSRDASERATPTATVDEAIRGGSESMYRRSLKTYSKSASARILFDALTVHQWHDVGALVSGPSEQSDSAELSAYVISSMPKLPRFIRSNRTREPRMRLASIVSAMNRGYYTPNTVERIASHSANDNDPAIDFALREAVARLKPVWEQMLALPDKGGLTEEQIAFLRNPAAAKPAAPKADPVVAKFVADALKPGAVVGKATPEFVAALSAEVRANGDAAKGAAVFKKAELGCTACHKIGNDGGTIGPDLNNIGSAQPLDFIIGAVIEPSREIKEGFEARIVTTKSGGTFTGFRRASAPDELALFDGATGKETKLKLTDIADNKPLGSLMPAGLVEKLSREELRDLFAYLTALGRAGK